MVKNSFNLLIQKSNPSESIFIFSAAESHLSPLVLRRCGDIGDLLWCLGSTHQNAFASNRSGSCDVLNLLCRQTFSGLLRSAGLLHDYLLLMARRPRNGLDNVRWTPTCGLHNNIAPGHCLVLLHTLAKQCLLCLCKKRQIYLGKSMHFQTC